MFRQQKDLRKHREVLDFERHGSISGWRQIRKAVRNIKDDNPNRFFLFRPRIGQKLAVGVVPGHARLIAKKLVNVQRDGLIFERLWPTDPRSWTLPGFTD